MSTEIRITFNPKGFAECLEQMSGQVQAEAEKIATRATGYIQGGGTGFHVELSNEPLYQDSQYGVSRPVARVVSNDEATAAEEAEYKILSKAVTG